MPKVSPKWIFWLMFVTTIAQGITSGTVHLTGLIPSEAIPVVTGWLGLFVFVAMSFLTLLSGASGPGVGPLAKPTTVAEAAKIMDEAKNHQK